MIRLMSMSVIALGAAILSATARSAQPIPEAGSDGASTDFTVRIENVSTTESLELSTGETAPAPTAPVLWVIHTGESPLFTKGERDRGEGLEALAEDGSPAALHASLQGKPGIAAAGFVNTPLGASEPGPILPGQAYEFTASAVPGQKLTVAFMFGQSNDLFYAPRQKGIDLFDGSGEPVGGDLTGDLVLWDAGTEVNQEPGLGPDQAPRQAGDNIGASEDGAVRPVKESKDGFTYPDVERVVRLTVRAAGVSE